MILVSAAAPFRIHELFGHLEISLGVCSNHRGHRGHRAEEKKKAKRLSFAEAEEFHPRDSHPFLCVPCVLCGKTIGAREAALTAVVYFRPFRQPIQPLVGEHGSLKAPVPVTRGLAGVIHARFAAQIEDVLQGRDGQIGHGGPG
jgi:hypothetical protein